MQRIIIDTNVLVSACIQKSYPYLIIDNISKNENIQLCISGDVFDEYAAVLGRDKFSKYADFNPKAKRLLEEVKSTSTKYYPKTSLAIIKDISDNKFLELAEECKADFLITGNTKDFIMSNFGSTVIISPKEYWEKFRQP